jgi:amidophosphoribosyltransferase
MCGVFGVHVHPHAAQVVAVGLQALQHRGQESAGLAVSTGPDLHVHRAMGSVADVFDEATLAGLPGQVAIGQVRYSTTGSSLLKNAQPLCVESARGVLAIVHNGNLTNALPLRRELQDHGVVFTSSTDTEVVLHLLAQQTEGTLAQRLLRTVERLEGAFSLLVLQGDELVAARDPHGYRPLVLGKRTDPNGNVWMVASESAALSLCGAQLEREVEPGEVVALGLDGPASLRMSRQLQRKACVFEHVYFARPDSQVFGQTVFEVRKRFGMQLAIEQPVPGAEVVVPVPDSGVSAALGYASQAGLPYEFGLIHSQVVGRSFIQPTKALRETGVRRKLVPVADVVAGRSLVVVDDSLVRGTTSRQIIGLLRAAGAREVHLRIAAPPTAWPCYYGIDTPDRGQLIASRMDLKQMAAFFSCDSVAYLSEPGLLAAANGQPGGWCTACFSGDYPEPMRR